MGRSIVGQNASRRLVALISLTLLSGFAAGCSKACEQGQSKTCAQQLAVSYKVSSEASPFKTKKQIAVVDVTLSNIKQVSGPDIKYYAFTDYFFDAPMVCAGDWFMPCGYGFGGVQSNTAGTGRFRIYLEEGELPMRVKIDIRDTWTTSLGLPATVQSIPEFCVGAQHVVVPCPPQEPDSAIKVMSTADYFNARKQVSCDGFIYSRPSNDPNGFKQRFDYLLSSPRTMEFSHTDSTGTGENYPSMSIWRHEATAGAGGGGLEVIRYYVGTPTSIKAGEVTKVGWWLKFPFEQMEAPAGGTPVDPPPLVRAGWVSHKPGIHTVGCMTSQTKLKNIITIAENAAGALQPTQQLNVRFVKNAGQPADGLGWCYKVTDLGTSPKLLPPVKGTSGKECGELE